VDGGLRAGSWAWTIFCWVTGLTGAAVIAWASTTWAWYWATFNLAGVAAAFLIAWVLLGLGFLFISFAIQSWRRVANRNQPPKQSTMTIPSVHFPTPDWLDPLVPVVNQTFRNRAVELDGKAFVDCRFENVTFVYNATKPTSFTHCSRPSDEKQYLFKTKNPAVGITVEIINWLHVTAGKPGIHERNLTQDG
jgi:hypothetical protein